MLLPCHPGEVKLYESCFRTKGDFCDLGQQADLSTKTILGQTFCDLQTLMHTFLGFPGACCKVTILIFWIEGWTFVRI